MVSPPHLFKNKKFFTARTSAACQAPFVFITEYQAGVKEINKQRETTDQTSRAHRRTGRGGCEVSLVPQSLRNNISILTHGQIHLSSLLQMILPPPPIESALLDMTDALLVQAFLFNPTVHPGPKDVLHCGGGEAKSTRLKP